MSGRGTPSDAQLLLQPDVTWTAENKSKADAQEPYIQGGQEGTDKRFISLLKRERERHLEDKQEHQPQRGNPCKH